MTKRDSYRRLIPTGWYYVTVRQAYRTESTLFLCFTIDRGEFAYRNIIEEFSLTETGLQRLYNLFYEMGRLISTNTDTDYFVEQFKNEKIRAHAQINRRVNDDAIENIITELKIPLKDEDYNVLKPKSETHYHENNTGRELPINE